MAKKLKRKTVTITEYDKQKKYILPEYNRVDNLPNYLVIVNVSCYDYRDGRVITGSLPFTMCGNEIRQEFDLINHALNSVGRVYNNYNIRGKIGEIGLKSQESIEALENLRKADKEYSDAMKEYEKATTDLYAKRDKADDARKIAKSLPK